MASLANYANMILGTPHQVAIKRQLICSSNAGGTASYGHHARAILDPGIQHISPSLKHGSALLGVLSLVVDSAHSALLMGKTLLDPVAVKAGLMQ